MRLQDDFEKWFEGMEVGDGEIRLPVPSDGHVWDEYVLRHSLALGAYKAATDRAVRIVWDELQKDDQCMPIVAEGIIKALKGE